MYYSMCFMSIVALLVMDMRTGALEESDILPNQCYNCYANDTTSCELSIGWTSVTCATKQPLCATMTSAPDFRTSLICAPDAKEPCTVKTALNSSFVLTCICKSHLCNAPFTSEWRNIIISFISNSTDIKQQRLNELLIKFTNITEEDKFYKAITNGLSETVTKLLRTSTKHFTPLPTPVTVNMRSILRDSERPRAESLKQEPTLPSDDDEDESEGSGAYEESRIRNNAVSGPAAPSSFLPDSKNCACPIYNFLSLVYIFFLYFVL